jgi:hypothetical protein
MRGNERKEKCGKIPERMEDKADNEKRERKENDANEDFKYEKKKKIRS